MSDPGPARRDGLSWNDFRAARGRFLDALARDAAAHGGAAGDGGGVPGLEAAWATGWPEEVAQAYAPDAVRHELGGPRTQRGRVAIAGAVAALMADHPGAALEVPAVHAAGAVAVLEWRLGPLCGVSVCRMDRGFIAEERVYAVAPAPAGGAAAT